MPGHEGAGTRSVDCCRTLGSHYSRSEEKNYDSASIEERVWKSEGTETESSNVILGARLVPRIFSKRLVQDLSLQAVPRQRPIAFTLEGSPLNRCHQ
jgi:hypothetical protein